MLYVEHSVILKKHVYNIFRQRCYQHNKVVTRISEFGHGSVRAYGIVVRALGRFPKRRGLHFLYFYKECVDIFYYYWYF